MPTPLTPAQQELLACAARLVVEDGFEYGQAKRQALDQLGLPARNPLPNNDALEDAVTEYIHIFCADTQPQELNKLREIALKWMQLTQEFSPLLSGAVWHGTATRHSDIYLQLFCDDPKMAEIFLINQEIKYYAGQLTDSPGHIITVLTAQETIAQWHQRVNIHMSLYDYDQIRRALARDSKGRTPKGSLQAVQALLATAS